jgi:hypothetical protein
MRELGNGQIVKLRGNYTGERLRTEREERIVNLLSLGEPVAAIARITRSSRNTVDAIRARRWSDIEQRKRLIRDSAARLAVKGFERLNEEMDAGKIKGSLLMTVTGMATDKVVALSNNAMQINVTQPIEPSKRLWEKLNLIAAQIEREAREARLALSNGDAVSDSGSGNGLNVQEETPKKEG